MRGYSLLELLVALAITASLSAASMPTLNQHMGSLLLQQASDQWLTYLHQVKAKARRTERALTAELVPTEQSAIVFQLPTRSTFRTSAPLTFYGISGGATPGHIRFEKDNRQVKVIISSKGRVRTCLSQGESVPGISAC